MSLLRPLRTIPTLTRQFATAAPAIAVFPHYILTYTYPLDILTLRTPHREGHVSLAKKLKEEGYLVLAGGVNPPLITSSSSKSGKKLEVGSVPEEGVFVFTNLESAKRMVDEDVYVKNGCVKDWTIREWSVVIK